MKRMLGIALAVAAAMVVFSCGGDKGTATGSGKGTITFGVFTSMTGANANWGLATKEGVTLATDEFNAAGGFNGMKANMLLEDDASRVEQAKTVAEKLVREESVCCLLGEVASGCTKMGGDVAQKAGTPLISSASTRVDLVNIGDCFNRVCFADDFQGALLAKFALSKGWKRIGLLTDKKNPYSMGLAQYFKDYAARHGGQIVGEQFYQSNDPAFDVQMTSLKAAAPQVVVVPGYHTDVIAISRAAKNNQLGVPLLGGDGWDNPALYSNAGDAIVGDYFSDHFINTDPRPEVKRFVDAYAKKWGHKPEAIAALAYDSTRVLFDAVKRANSTDPAKLKVAIRATKDFPGVTGSITIDPKGDCRKPAVVIQIQPDGAFKAIEMVPWFDAGK